MASGHSEGLRLFRPLEEKDEYSQALLDDYESGDKNSSLPELPAKQTGHIGRLIWLCSALTLLSLCLTAVILLGLTRASGSRYQHSGVTSEVVQDEYILSADWHHSAPPQLREYDWTLEETEFNPDGVYRPMLLINNHFPGPLIEANEGDTIKVTVHNHMSNATSIHWHGIYQIGTNYMDGTTGVTQCPIPPGATFTYEFTIRNQSGTYWYHAHQGAQASDGLAGPLIVHHKDERESQMLQYVTDRVLMLSDHYHHLTSSLTRQYLAPDMENTEPVPVGALINGRAVRNCDDFPDRKCDNSTLSYPRMSLEPGQRHRLRIINIGAFAEFQFQIDEHELAVTEADGTDVHPVYYHRLNVSPAQRYSVIVNTNQTHRSSFKMRANMVDDCFAGSNAFMVKEVQGIVNYNNDISTLPDSLDWTEQLDVECRDMNVTELVPTQSIPAPAKEDAFFYFRTNFRIGDYRLSRGYFNESSWKTNVSSPTLSRYIDMTTADQHNIIIADDSISLNPSPFPPSSQLTVTSRGIQTIDVLIHNTDDGAHPMHLHGYKYFVLASGKGYPPRRSMLDGVSRATLQPLYDTLNLSNPLRRDTATVEADGWLLIRFVADNPGAWAFHCHLAWHAEAGLVMQFLTRVDELVDMRLSGALRGLCEAPVEELERGTAPADEVYYQEAAEGDSDRNGSGCEGESVSQCSYDE